MLQYTMRTLQTMSPFLAVVSAEHSDIGSDYLTLIILLIYIVLQK
jgi:hypothetical protein